MLSPTSALPDLWLEMSSRLRPTVLSYHRVTGGDVQLVPWSSSGPFQTPSFSPDTALSPNCPAGRPESWQIEAVLFAVRDGPHRSGVVRLRFGRCRVRRQQRLLQRRQLRQADFHEHVIAGRAGRYGRGAVRGAGVRFMYSFARGAGLSRPPAQWWLRPQRTAGRRPKLAAV